MDVLATLPHIYDAAISQNNWVSALDQTASVISAKGALLLANNKTHIPYSISTSNNLYSDKGEIIKDYISKYNHYEQEVIEILSNSPQFSPVLDTDIWPDLNLFREREDVVYIRKNVGIFRRVAFNLSNNTGCDMAAVFQFDNLVETIPKEALGISKQLVPHLAKALEINRFFFQLLEKYNAILSALDHVKIGVCIMAPSGHLVIVNDEAKRIFEAKDGISIDRDNRLVCSNEDLNSQIKHYLTANSETARGQNHICESLLVVTRRSGLEPLIVEMSPLRDGDGEYEIGFAGTLFTIIDPTNSSKFSINSLKKVYNLSNAESEIASYLAKGYTTIKIADIRNVSTNTVKTQTKVIYSKTNVKNRSQLIRKIVALSPPIT